MKKTVMVFFKVLLWLFLSFMDLLFFGYFSIEIVEVIFALFFSILLWLFIFKRKLLWFLLMLAEIAIYFLIYFLVPSNDCGMYASFKFPPIHECNCVGVKKIERDGDIRCIGRVNGWK